MKHYCTQLIKSQIFHCRIFIEYLRNCYLKAQCPSQILPPAHVFDIRCSVGFHPTNCHRFWDTFWCTWTLKTDWISDWYQNCLCVWAQYKVLHYQLCPAVRVSAECISGACTVYSIVHLAHIAHTVSIVVTPLHAIWCYSQYNCALLYGSMSTQMLHISQKPTANSTKLHTTSSVYKAALCLSQQLFNTLACQEAALHFTHALPMLFVLYSIHFLHIIVLCTS